MNKLSLSLLDLLACGFGSVILLFFVTIVVWEQISAQDRSMVPTTHESGKAPFVLLILPDDSSDARTGDSRPRRGSLRSNSSSESVSRETSASAPILFKDATYAAWSVEKQPSGFVWGSQATTTHAAFYANQPPRDDTTLDLSGFDSSVTGVKAILFLKSGNSSRVLKKHVQDQTVHFTGKEFQ